MTSRGKVKTCDEYLNVIKCPKLNVLNGRRYSFEDEFYFS